MLDADGVSVLVANTIEATPVEWPLDPLTPVWRAERLPPGAVVGDHTAAAQLRTEGALLTAAYLVGMADALTDLAVEYAKEREQFDRPIGSFQAVKHICADMVVRAEVARVAVHAAACVLDDPEVGPLTRSISGAKLLANEAAVLNGRVGDAGVRRHGLHVGGRRPPLPQARLGARHGLRQQRRARRPGRGQSPLRMSDWDPLLEDLALRRAAATAMGGEERLARQRADGRLDARARVERLLDPDSFVELGALVGSVQRGMSPPAPADGLIAGHGAIDGRPVLVGAEDFTVMGGSIGLGAHAKRVRLARLAAQEQVPLVMLLEGAGERAQNAYERYPHAPNDLQELARLSGQVPTVAVVMGVSAGHGALTAPLMDFTVMVEGAAMFSAGPPLVAAATGEEVGKEELGGTAVHTVESGVAHNAAAGRRRRARSRPSVPRLLPEQRLGRAGAAGHRRWPAYPRRDPRSHPGRSAPRLRHPSGAGARRRPRPRRRCQWRERHGDRARVRSCHRDCARAHWRLAGRGRGQPARGEGGCDRRRGGRQGRALPRGRGRVPPASAVPRRQPGRARRDRGRAERDPPARGAHVRRAVAGTWSEAARDACARHSGSVRR